MASSSATAAHPATARKTVSSTPSARKTVASTSARKTTPDATPVLATPIADDDAEMSDASQISPKTVVKDRKRKLSEESEPSPSEQPAKAQKIANGKKKATATASQEKSTSKKDVPKYTPTHLAMWGKHGRQDNTIDPFEVRDNGAGTTIKFFKISGDVHVAHSPVVPKKGHVTSYNLTQMNKNWMKSLVMKLREVSQIEWTVRGWLRTVLHALGDANVPDESDEEILERIERVRKDIKRNQISVAEAEQKLDQLEEELEAWSPAWLSQPLYQVDIVRNMFEDKQIVIIVLTTTEGQFFIRALDDGTYNTPFGKFVHFIDVQHKTMKGYNYRPRSFNFNGYGFEEYNIDADFEKQLTDMDKMFREQKCVSIWRHDGLATEEEMRMLLSTPN